MENINTSTIKTGVVYTMSTLLMFSGIRTILDPLGQAEVYGIIATPASSPYINEWAPVMGARNFAFGLSIGTLMLQGKRSAAGTVLCSAIVMGFVDTWVTARHNSKWTLAVWSHAIVDPLIALAGWWVME